MRDRAGEEISKGRLWRAKEILRGRLADAEYEPALFEQMGDVLAAMHDDDEAGRFYLLAGRADGEAGALARAFLTRRSKRSFARLWSGMPAAACRGQAERLAPGTLALLKEAGFEPPAIKQLLAEGRRRTKANSARRKTLRTRLAEEARSQRIGFVMATILLVVLAVGTVGTIRLIGWAIAKLAGLA